MQKNQQQAISDIIEILPTLQRGMDVNVKFSGVADFEFNDYISIFDMLGVSLYHGWLVDPQDEVAWPIISKLSYNKIVERVIEGGSSGSTGDAVEAEVCRAFLDDTSSQLTYHGLMELHEKVKERQLCVFFRNNHFSTMFKIEGRLVLLLTDIGYLKRNQCAWESLGDIDGNTDILSPTFGEPNEYFAVTEEYDLDRMLAQQLQDEEAARAASVSNTPRPPRQSSAPNSSLSPEGRYLRERERYQQERAAFQRQQKSQDSKGGCFVQ